MFVPVACSRCSKPFQVPSAVAGTTVACPWCKASVVALPVAGVSEPAQAPMPVSSPLSIPEPLSLDPEPSPTVASAPAQSRKFPFRRAILVVALSVLAFGATLFYRGYHAGRVPESAWNSFTPPDGSCTVDLPGEPTAHPLNALPIAVCRGGEEFITDGWYSGVQAWVGWYDLDPAWAKAAAEDKDGGQIDPILNAGQKQRVDSRKATIRKEGKMLVDEFRARELQIESEAGPAIEWLCVVPTGTHPRLYFFGIQGKNISPESPLARRIFTKFRVNEK